MEASRLVPKIEQFGTSRDTRVDPLEMKSFLDKFLETMETLVSHETMCGFGLLEVHKACPSAL